MNDDEYIKRGLVVPDDHNKSLTKSVGTVKRDLPKYWHRDYINERINQVSTARHRVFLQFLWITGVRVTEAVSLRKKDIDYENYTLRVLWQKSRTNRYRMVALHPSLRDVLWTFTASLNAEDRVFPFSRQRAWQICRKHMRGGPHMFRHSFAVNWLRCGGDIVSLHRHLGHSKVQTTMEYLKIVPVDTGKELIKVVF